MQPRIDSETLEAFLLGELSGVERAGVEAQLAADPAFASEANLQQDIIGGLRENRRLELKARLQAVPAPTIGFWTKTRVAASLLLGLLLMGGSALFFTQGTESESKAQATQNNAQDEALAIAQSDNQNEATSQNAAVDAQSPQVVGAPLIAAQQREASRSTQTRQPDEQVAFSLESVQRPVLPTVEGDNPNPVGEKQSIDAPRGEEMGAGAPTVRLITPEIQSKKGKFHYRFDGERLTLIGEFDKTTYTLYELSYAKVQMFLSYKGKYYEIVDTGGEVMPLLQVTNQTLIRSLPE